MIALPQAHTQGHIATGWHQARAHVGIQTQSPNAHPFAKLALHLQGDGHGESELQDCSQAGAGDRTGGIGAWLASQ